MTLQNSSDQVFSNNSDGFSLGGGNTLRTLTLAGDDFPLLLNSVASGHLLQFNGSNWINIVPNYGTGSVTQIVAGNGLTGGTITNVGTISLPATGVTPGTYQGLTIDTYGRITSASSLAIKNLVIVQENPGVGQYSSINSALASITDASVSNPYKILVGPGTYSETQINMKPYVYLFGSGKEEVTIIQASGTNQNVINGTDFSGVFDCLLTGATGSGYSGIYYTSNSSSQDAGFTVENVRLGNNDTLITAEGITQFSTVYCSNIEFGGTYQLNHGFVAKNSGGSAKITIINGRTRHGMIAPYPSDVFTAQGTGCEINLSSVRVRSYGTTAGAGIQISDGATAVVSDAVIQGFYKGLWVENVGMAPTIALNDSYFSNNAYDVVIDHPSCQGYVDAAFDTSISSISSTGVAVFCTNPVDGLTFTGDITIGTSFDTRVKYTDLIFQSPPMGLVNSGSLLGTLSAGSGFTVNISPGRGYYDDIVSDQVALVTWGGTSITLTANTSNYIYFNTSGLLTSSFSAPDTKHNILLGRAVTNGSGIEFIDESPFSAHHPSNSLDNTLRYGIGPIFGVGCLVSESSTPLNLNVTAGTYFFGENEFNPSAGTNIYFDTFYRDGSGGWIITQNQQTIDTSNYDNNSGTLASIGSGNYARHALYLIGDGTNQKYMMVYAQTTYAALVEAQNGNIPAPPSYFTDSVVSLASIVVLDGATSIISGGGAILDTRPTLSFTAPSATAQLVHGNLLGLSADDHKQYLLVTGSRAMSGNLDLGSNNIINIGSANGVVIQAHASRHLPNGADPIATSGATSNLNANTTNSVGVQNSLSRSDHGHAIDTGTAISIGTANTPGTAASLIRSDHTHQGIHSLKVDSGTARYGDITFVSGTDISLVDNGAGTFTFNASGLGTGSVTNIATGTGLTGGPITDNGTISVSTNGISNALFRQSAANTLVGNSTGSTANVTDITLGTTLAFVTGSLQTRAFSGDVTSAANSFSLTLGSNVVTNSKLRKSSALSVIGNATNVTADPADIIATANSNQVLMVSSSGTALTWNTIQTANIANSAITYAKIQNESANTILGNPTGTAQAPQEISIGTGLVFSGTTLQVGTSGVTAGTYSNASITVDALGRVTQAATGTALVTGDMTFHPGINSTVSGGNYYDSPWVCSANFTGVTYATGTLFAWPTVFPSGQTITRIGANVTTAKTGGLIRFGIYSNNAGLPGTKLVDSGDISAATTGAKEATINYTFDGSIVWLVFESNLSNIGVTGYNPDNTGALLNWWLGRSTAAGASTTVIDVPQAYGALPTTFPNGTGLIYDTVHTPYIWVRNV